MLLIDSNNSKNNKDKVVEITLYIANYCMERYIAKFSSSDAVVSNSCVEPAGTECLVEVPKIRFQMKSLSIGSICTEGQMIMVM